MLSYKRLWDTMEDRGISAYALTTRYGFSRHTIHRLRHDMGISSSLINQLCGILSCRVEDIVTYYPDEESTSVLETGQDQSV